MNYYWMLKEFQKLRNLVAYSKGVILINFHSEGCFDTDAHLNNVKTFSLYLEGYTSLF
jgi:hypothetical protein